MDTNLILNKDYIQIKSKEHLNHFVSDEEIMLFFYGNFKIGTHNQCPFRPEKRPSFFIDYYKKQLRWIRFGLFDNKSFDVINLIMLLYDLKYYPALQFIYNEMVLKKPTKSYTKDQLHSIQQKRNKKKQSKILEYTKEWSDKALNVYWDRYYFTKELMIKHNVYPLHRLWIGDELFHEWSSKEPFYVYLHDEGREIWTTYKPELNDLEDVPFNIDRRFRKKNTRGHVMGLDLCQQSERRNVGFITSSKKDIIAIDLLGFDSIAPHSESGWNYEEFLNAVMFMKQHYKYVYVAFDNDKTGVENSIKLTKTFGLHYWNVPKEVGGDDPSAYIEKTNPEIVKKSMEQKFKRDGIDWK